MHRRQPSSQAKAQSEPPPRIPIEYITAREAAAFLGLGVQTLNAMRRSGLGPDYVKVSKSRVVYEIEALRAYTTARTVRPLLESSF